MLERVDFPLSNNQLTNFFLDKGYTTYFHVQQTLYDLLESNLISEKKSGNNNLYFTTEEGQKTLSYFENHLSDEIREEIDSYMTEHNYDMKVENSTIAEYYRTPEQEYMVHFQVKEKKNSLITLELTVPTKEMAQEFCKNWNKKSSEIYGYLMNTLSN